MKKVEKKYRLKSTLYEDRKYKNTLKSILFNILKKINWF